MTATTVRRKLTVGLTPEQFEARRAGIGGSDAAAVLGCNPYRSALDVYKQKIGETGPTPPNAAMKRGTFLEPIARKIYAELTGRRIRRMQQVTHASFPWMLCNIDGRIFRPRPEIDASAPGVGPGLLELKCPGIWAFAKAKREGLPIHWIVQVQHNLEVTGYTWGAVALFNADLWEMIHFDVPRDLELAHAIILKEKDFWKNHVECRTPPPDESNFAPEIAAALERAEGSAPKGTIILRNDAEWAEAAETYLSARELAETAENLEKAAKDRIKTLLGEYGGFEGAGLRVYFSRRDGRMSFDKKALIKARPIDRQKVLAWLADVDIMPIEMRAALADALGKAGIDLNLADFEHRGEPYDDFRGYRVKAGIGD